MSEGRSSAKVGGFSGTNKKSVVARLKTGNAPGGIKGTEGRQLGVKGSGLKKRK